MEKITAKQQLLNAFIAKDRTGATQKLHDALMSDGFKWKAQGKTIMYYTKGKEVDLGLVAMRPGLMSFPKNFWLARSTSLHKAMGMLSPGNRIALEGPFFTSSQESAGQLALDTTTLPTLLKIVKDIVIPEANAAGASLGIEKK